MIIYDDADAASVHTLVSPQNPSPESPLSPTRTHIPPLIAPLSLAFLAASIPPILFSIISLPLSLISTLPTIIVFTLSIPFHIGAIYIVHNGLSQNPNDVYRWPLRVVSKTVIMLYSVFLQLLWLASAVTNGLILVNSRRKLKNLCHLHFGDFDDTNDMCVRKTLMIFLISMVLSSVIVMILGVASWSLFRWNHTIPSSPEPSTPVTAPTTANSSEIHAGTYFLIPLMYGSFGFTLPPFVIALDSFGNPYMSRFSISTTIAYTLATHAHIMALHRWYRDYKAQKTPTQERSLPAPTITGIIYLLLLLALWTTVTVMCAGFFLMDGFSGRTYLDVYCSGGNGCLAQANVYLGVLTISTSIEVLLLGAMIVISLRYQIRQRRVQRANSSMHMGHTDKFSRTPVQEAS